MKKINLGLLIICIAAFASCKKDPTNAGNGNNANSSVLPKKIVETYSNAPNSPKTYDYTYNGNKISEILITPSFDVSKIKYTYTGDDITKIENFSGANFAPYGTVDISYQSGKVSSAINKNSAGNIISNTTFTHNNDGSVTKTTVPTTVGQVTTISKYYVTNGNIVKEEFLDNAGVPFTTYVNEFDLTKFHYTKNITGFGFTFTNRLDNLNSLTKTTRTTTGQAPIVTNPSNSYNANNYVTQITEPYSGTTNVTRVITY